MTSEQIENDTASFWYDQLSVHSHSHALAALLGTCG